MRILLKVVAFFFLFLGMNNSVIYCAENASVSGIERTQEILEKEKALRERIEKGEKIFIKRIVVSGITLIEKDRIKRTTLPFRNSWLSRDDIQEILDLIVANYKQNGYEDKIARIFYKIKKSNLEIVVEER